MDFTLDSEQLALKKSVRSLFASAAPGPERRTLPVAPGFDEVLWKQLLATTGLPFVDDDGIGAIEIGLIAEEIGRQIAPEPFIEVGVLTAGLIAAVSTADQRRALLDPVEAGEGLVVLAHQHPTPGNAAAVASRVGSDDAAAWTVSGIKEPVLYAGAVAGFIVPAVHEGATLLFHVDARAAGVVIREFTSYDGTFAGHVVLDGAPATLLGDSLDDRSDELSVAVARATIAYAREALGAMKASTRMTVDYLKQRRQFGAPLSGLQALRFRAADLYVEIQLVTSIAEWATMVAAEPDATSSQLVETAARVKAYVGRAARLVSQEVVQLHGGIGMSDEYAVGHYATRLLAFDGWLGSSDEHVDRLSLVATDPVFDPLR